jgi:hypothetical protein
MSYNHPHNTYQSTSSNSYGAIPSPVLIVQTLKPVQALPTAAAMITEGLLLIHMRLHPLKLAAFHGRVARCQVPGRPPPARHKPPTPMEQGKTGNVSTAND